jgi:sporulation protein YlmC with PRC-barrel domain
MKPSASLKLVSQLLDLPLRDKDGNYCGIVDDIELSGTAGKEARITALLVGPGAYEGRMPRWAMWLVRRIAGDRITRVPMAQVDSIKTAVHLKASAGTLGLHRSEDLVRAYIPRVGAM